MSQEQKPSVGRIVHFGYSQSSMARKEPQLETRAAIITQVAGEYATLTVFHPNGVMGTRVVAVPHSDELKEGHWSWPPRV
jgi:hypothetical protein